MRLIVAAILFALARLSAQSVSDEGPFRFHHLHLNSPGLIDFYSRLFDPATTSRPIVAGFQGLRAGPMLLLFNSTASPATPGPSPIWHFGWGTVTLGETYLQHAAGEVVWEPPLPAGRLHLHLLSRSPGVAAAWYADVLEARVEVMPGADAPTRTQAARAELRVAEAAVHFGDFSMLIYRTTETLVPSQGKSADHVALACENLDEVVARFRASKVPIVQAPATFGDTRAATIEGPDRIGIELIEASRAVPDRR